ncbi:MAG: hypothetical protein QM778_25600 [Myxococcales bacterium]
MGLVYVYLAAWIAGGVLLGSMMLLEHPHDQPDAEELAQPVQRSAGLHALALALTGFGLGGLLAEGLGLVPSPWTAGCALAGAMLLGAGGYLSGQFKRARDDKGSNEPLTRSP